MRVLRYCVFDVLTRQDTKGNPDARDLSLFLVR